LISPFAIDLTVSIPKVIAPFQPPHDSEVGAGLLALYIFIDGWVAKLVEDK